MHAGKNSLALTIDTRGTFANRIEYKKTCLWSSTTTLCVLQLHPNTLLPDTAEPTSVEDVVNEDQCVLAVGLRRWRVADGQEVGNQMAMDVSAISVSMDGKWIVCGSRRGASVWDAKTQDNVIEVDGTDIVGAVDISPDSARFAAVAGRGSGHKASIWNIITGERLVGPLQHDRHIAGIKFPGRQTYCYRGQK